MNINDRELLARTLQAEAGNQGFGGMMAAGSVIMNRTNAAGYGNGLRGVILKPGQFSAWNSATGYAGGEQGQDMANMRASDDAYKAADALITGGYEDKTGGATHYYNPSFSNPDWGRDKAGGDWKQIGDHVFGFADADKKPNPNQAIADDTMRALGKSPKGILAPTQTSETETKPMMQQQKPRGLLERLGVQKMEEGAEGEAGQRFYNRESFGDTLANLAPALGRMGVMGLDVPAQAMANSRREDKLVKAAAAKTEAERNSTGKWLVENGFKDIGEGVLSGAISGTAGLQMSQKAGNTKDTALIRNALAAGYKPGTPEYQRFIASGGDIFSQEAAIRANLPKPESGMAYEFEKDERGNIVGYKLVPIEGGKADRNAQKTKEGEDTVLTTAGLVLDNINSIQDMLKNSKLPIAGLTGNMLQKVPGTSAYDVSALAATIKANIGFDRLQRMRMESPTGGALGNVSNQELTSLQATLGNLDQAQSQQQFADQLQDIEAQYLAILNKFNEYPEDVRAKVGYTKTKISEAPTGSTQEIEAEDGVYTIKQKP